VVEFALVFPILLIILVGVADLGRVFNAGVIAEGAARNAAEHAAQKYLADPPGDTTQTAATRLAAPVAGFTGGYYDAIRTDAAATACAEMRGQTNTDYSGGVCPTWPVLAVCVHDNADPGCGTTAPGFAPVPSSCNGLRSGWSNSTAGTGERWVEVRICYRFTSLLHLPIFEFGEIYLERQRSFTIPCYFATGFGPCG
jgi:hypothetical protein